MRTLEVDSYIDSAPDYAKPILTNFRDAVHKACPDVKEVIKWGFPCFDYQGLMCGMAAHKQHCSLTLWKGTMINDPDGILEVVGKTGMGTFGKIRSLEDLPSDDKLMQYLLQAVELQDKGVRVPRKTAEQKKLTIPTPLEEALKSNPQAREVFDAFSYSNKKEYVEWLDSAKTEATRTRRLAQAIEWISEGKPRNWKYMK